MRSTIAIPFYYPGESAFHREHIAAKLLIFLWYALLILTSHQSLALLALILLLTGTTILMKVPLRAPLIIGVLVLLLAGLTATSTEQTIAGRLIVATSKLVSLTLLVSLFSMTTKVTAILQFLRSGSSRTALEPVAYIINTMLAVFPSIQYDMQRAFEAETIRRGKRVGYFSIGSWGTVLTVVVVRTMERAERFTETVIDRGYAPSQGVHFGGQPRISKRDLLTAVVCMLPGLFVWAAFR